MTESVAVDDGAAGDAPIPIAPPVEPNPEDAAPSRVGWAAPTSIRHEAAHEAPRGRYLLTLCMGAIGVVYGDIGTSPLYAIRECFYGPHRVPVTEDNILGVLSLVFWALVAVVTVKYLGLILRADNNGEGGVLALGDEDWQHTLDANLLAAVRLDRGLLPGMLKQGAGVIIHISSIQRRLPLFEATLAYAAAKAGLMAVARALAVELGPKRIRVNTVSPGTIATPMLDRSLAGMAADEVEGFLERVRRANALGRIGDPRDVANVTVFLCSDGAAYVTGEDVVVDGGYLRVKTF